MELVERISFNSLHPVCLRCIGKYLQGPRLKTYRYIIDNYTNYLGFTKLVTSAGGFYKWRSIRHRLGYKSVWNMDITRWKSKIVSFGWLWIDCMRYLQYVCTYTEYMHTLCYATNTNALAFRAASPAWEARSLFPFGGKLRWSCCFAFCFFRKKKLFRKMIKVRRLKSVLGTAI